MKKYDVIGGNIKIMKKWWHDASRPLKKKPHETFGDSSYEHPI